MTDIATKARDLAISLEVKLTRHSKRGDGGLNLGFAVHPHGIPEEIRSAELGARFAMVLVELNDQDEPKEVVSSKSTHTVTSQPVPAPERPVRASKVRADKRLAQQAGICCSDPVFQVYLSEQYPGSFEPNSDIDFEQQVAGFVRDYCHIKSRSEIVPGSDAAIYWEKLYGKFQAWKLV